MTTDAPHVKQRSGASSIDVKQRKATSPTNLPRRRRPAQAARRFVGGASVAAVLGLVAVWSAAPDTPAAATTGGAVSAATAPTDLRVVITDPAIDHDAAIAAAVDAAARGLDRVEIAVAGSIQPSEQAMSNAAHSTSHAS